MTCAEVRQYVFAFLDSELDGALSIELQRHLEGCPRCAREAEIERTVRHHLSRALRAGASAAVLDERDLLRDVAREIPRWRRRLRFRPFAMATAGVAAALCIVTGLWLATKGETRHKFASLLATDYQKFLDHGGQVEFASTDPASASAWLRDQLGMTVSLSSLDGASRKLVGVRKCKLGGVPTAFVAYEIEGTPAVLAVLNGERLDMSGMRRVERDGRTRWECREGEYTIVACRRDDLVYAAISTLSGDPLLALVRAGEHGGK